MNDVSFSILKRHCIYYKSRYRINKKYGDDKVSKIWIHKLYTSLHELQPADLCFEKQQLFQRHYWRLETLAAPAKAYLAKSYLYSSVKRSEPV